MTSARTRTWTFIVVPAMATAGLMAGHVLTYGALYEGHAHRRAVLAATGHGYLSWASFAAAVALAIAVASSVRLGAHSVFGARHSSARATASRLVAAQTLAFVVLEVVERALADAPVSLSGRLLLVGVAIQLVVALAGTLVLRLSHRVGRIIASRRARPPHRSAAVATPPPVVRRARSARGVWASRAPPAPPFVSHAA